MKTTVSAKQKVNIQKNKRRGITAMLSLSCNITELQRLSEHNIHSLCWQVITNYMMLQYGLLYNSKLSHCMWQVSLIADTHQNASVGKKRENLTK